MFLYRRIPSQGFKLIYGLGLGLTAVLTLISPIVIKWHYIAFMVLRTLIGFCEGATFPALNAMAAKWVPREERNRVAIHQFLRIILNSDS
jgi:MFS family permease